MHNNKSPDANVFGDDVDLVWLLFFFFFVCEQAHDFIRGFGYRYFVQCMKITQINTSLYPFGRRRDDSPAKKKEKINRKPASM